MAMPRFLPIVFVAVGGVLALKAIGSLDVMPDIFNRAQAVAAGAAAKKPEAKPVAKAQPKARAAGAEAVNSDDPTESLAVNPAMMAADAASGASDAAASVSATPVCATSIDQLAQQAGMSANELQILQSLGKRRAELDQREAQLNTRGQLIEAADSKLDSRIAQLSDLKTQIQALLDQATKVQDDDTTRLVAVYSAMKPKDAAAVLTTMSDDVRLPIAAKMKDRGLASILGAMTPDAARELTEKLAKRMQKADGLQQQLDKTTAGGAGAQASPAKGAAPAKGAPAKGK